MKTHVQSLIAKYPLLKRNPLYYAVQRYRQYRPCSLDRTQTDRQDILDAIVADGICVLPDFLPRSICEQIVAELEGPLQRLTSGTYEGLAQVRDFVDAYRIGDVDKVSPTAKRFFFEDKLISDMARAYVSRGVVSYRREADFKLTEVHGQLALQSELPHFDDWRHRFKAFLYVTDVGPENAPFVYYAGSHRLGSWRTRYHLEFEKDGEHGRYGYFFPQEMRRLIKQHGFREQVCTGAAGTLIFVDGRGIHRGTTLRAGRRILLNDTFGITLPGI